MTETDTCSTPQLPKKNHKSYNFNYYDPEYINYKKNIISGVSRDALSNGYHHFLIGRKNDKIYFVRKRKNNLRAVYIL